MTSYDPKDIEQAIDLVSQMKQDSGSTAQDKLLALPVAAALNVLVRRVHDEYRQSELYKASSEGGG